MIKNRDVALPSLSLAALGIVYGDIGTSPLYAMKVSLGHLPINKTDTLGVLSLIFWSLIIVVSIKYLGLMFHADNEGEGGILALFALLKKQGKKMGSFFTVLAMLGAGLMLGDGMLTPAISVVSAIEGLNVISPHLFHWVTPLTSVILIGLFTFQSFGTAKIGIVFGPVIFIWFIVLGYLGVIQILHYPLVLAAISPVYSVHFLLKTGYHGYVLLGGVFLVVTGAEAIYADLGHFGKKPIRLTWFYLVLPALILNYFGQGAYLLMHPEAIINPFYSIAPTVFMIPLLILATIATIIASQAVISATFSLTKQAILLGFYPPLPIVQTSASKEGQIYVPQMNMILAIGTLILIATFKNSDGIAHAYGIAVNIVMLITTLMTIYLAYKQWHWRILRIVLFFGLFVLFECAFFGANLEKILTGGWVPILFSAVATGIMLTWNQGIRYLDKVYYQKKEGLPKTLEAVLQEKLVRLPDTTIVFITDSHNKTGGGLVPFLNLTHSLPEHILIVTYVIENKPYVSLSERLVFQTFKKDIYQITLHYGFMDTISVPGALKIADKEKFLPFDLHFGSLTYLVETPNVFASRQKKSLRFYWQEKLFAYLMRNYSPNLNIEFYQLPRDKTIAVGSYYIL